MSAMTKEPPDGCAQLACAARVQVEPVQPAAAAHEARPRRRRLGGGENNRLGQLVQLAAAGPLGPKQRAPRQASRMHANPAPPNPSLEATRYGRHLWPLRYQ